jgi:hypothetical protein
MLLDIARIGDAIAVARARAFSGREACGYR